VVRSGATSIKGRIVASVQQGEPGDKRPEPRAPLALADRPSFELLSQRYNFGAATPPRTRLFLDLLLAESDKSPEPPKVLDIGCGRGIGRQARLTWEVRASADELWGIDPDPEVRPDPGLMDRFQVATMEEAALPPEYFDIAYSYMVMEHLKDPAAFLTAVHRTLAPGGRYLFVTPNARHYFGRLARLARRSNLEETVLRLVKGETVDDYHYPIQYRCNTPEVIDALAERIAFAPPEYVFSERRGPAGYLRGPLRPLWWAGRAKRRVVRNPKALLNIIVRMTKE
jgi:SAM-dependent methyltransferase